MEDQNLQNLRIHIAQITSNFVSEISEGDTILCLDQQDRVYPDAVSNHHLIDLLAELDPGIFYHYCVSLFRWLGNDKNEYSNHPFTLDSYTRFCSRSDENDRIFREKLEANQLPDGTIPVYTALIEGGDFFSTLWATKILINYDPEQFENVISKAIEYLINREKVAARSISQSGFLLFLLLRFKPDEYEEKIKSIYNKILPFAQNLLFDGNPIEILDGLYILEDLIEYYKWSQEKEAINIVADKLNILFELEREPEVPSIFKNWQNIRPQSTYYQMIIKSGVVAVKAYDVLDKSPLAIEINAHLHNQYRHIKYTGLKIEQSLKHYKKQYDGIEREFSNYEDHLKTMWDKSNSEYDKSIFLMMPFKSDLNFRVLTDEIKKTCSECGYQAFRVDDEHRGPFDTLWENIVLNMLGCKYGISVYVAEKSVDRISDELRFFENPNVALEFGFMKSRGKRILILKDISSKTPSDLQGFVWKPFDMKNPDTTVSKPIKKWIQEITEIGQQNDRADA